jgi:hypothetical protein
MIWCFYYKAETVNFLGAFAKLWKSIISFIMFVCLSIHRKNLAPPEQNFMKFGIQVFFGKSVNKIQVSLKYYKNNGYCAHVPIYMYIYDIISLNSTYNEHCFRQI